VRLFDRNQHLRRTVELLCPDDDSAIGQVALSRHRKVLEIWQGERRVWRFEATAF
jgi:hypothetical protein